MITEDWVINEKSKPLIYIVTQSNKFWKFTQRKRNHHMEKLSVPPYLLQLNLQYTRYDINLDTN